MKSFMNFEKYLNNHALSYFILIVFSLFFFFFQDPYVDLFQNYDQEFWNTYHALVLFSGYNQELFNDPGHLNYLLFSYYLKIINFLNIAEIPTIDQLNSSNIFVKEINNIVFHSRIFGFCTTITLYILIIELMKEFEIKYILPLTLILITGNGLLTHVSQYRVEPMTLLLFLISLKFLIIFLKNNFYNIFYLFLFNFFLILSIINKVQIIFYAPFYILIILLIKKNEFNYIKINNLINYKNTYFKRFLFTTLLIFFFIFFRSEQPHSIFYLIIIYFSYITCLIIILNHNNLLKILTLNNLCLISAFILIYIFTTYVSNATKEIYWVFFRISKIRGYLDSSLGGIDTFLWIKNFSYLAITYIISNTKNLFSLTTNNIIFFVIIFLLLTQKKYKFTKVSYVVLIIYFIIQYITQFRSLHYYYLIYFDWLIILTLGFVITNINIKPYIKILLLLFFFTNNIYLNINTKNLLEINSNFFNKNHYCSTKEIYTPYGAWSYFSARISKEKIEILCK